MLVEAFIRFIAEDKNGQISYLVSNIYRLHKGGRLVSGSLSVNPWKERQVGVLKERTLPLPHHDHMEPCVCVCV